MSVTLFVRNGGLAGQTFTFNDSHIPIGRDACNVLKLAPRLDERASGRHCELYENNGGYFIRDLGSTNGTYVNNQRIFAPTPLHDGALLKLGGNQGVEIVVKLNISESHSLSTPQSISKSISTVMQLHGLGVPGSVAGIPSKTDMGFHALHRKLDKVKVDVRSEHKSIYRMMTTAMVAMLLIGIGIGALIWRGFNVTQTRIDGIRDQVVIVRDRTLTAEKTVDGFKESVVTIKQQVADSQKTYDETKAAMASVMGRKEDDLLRIQSNIEQLARTASAPDLKRKEFEEEKLKAEFSKLQAMVTEVKEFQNNPANKRFEAAPANAFVDTAARVKNGIYAIYFTAAGRTERTLVGTAFAVDSAKGLLATSGNLGASIRDAFLAAGQIVVECNGRPFISYTVKRAIVHDRYTVNKSSRTSPDAALLEVDLGSSSVGFPYTFNVLGDADQEHVSMALNVAMLGFNDDAKEAARSSATLAMGVVSSTTNFGAMPAHAHGFDLLEHTCSVGTNDEGSPIFDDRGRVVAVQCHAETDLIRVADKADPSKTSVKTFPVGNVRYAASAQFLRELLGTHRGAANLK